MATALRLVTDIFDGVSIHATLAGGDIPVDCDEWACDGFYPRHPRGWRRSCPQAAGRRLCVSIHATLAGGDVHFCLQGGLLFSFLSTPPSRVATPCRERPAIYIFVSIHATLAGGDTGIANILQIQPVSIHATLAGGDMAL